MSKNKWTAIYLTSLLSGMMLLYIACKPSQSAMKPSNSPQTSTHGHTVTMRDIAHSTRCGVTEQQHVLILSQEEWTALWAQVTSREIPPLPLPAIDFTKECIVACFLGAKPTGGYGLSITKIQQHGSEIAVSLEEVFPGKGCMVTEAFVYPNHLVAIPRTGVEKAVFTTVRNETLCK